MKMPWPVGLALAALVFLVFHTYQLVAPQDALNSALLPAIRIFAYFFMAMFVFASLVSYLTQKTRSKKFRNTQSISDIRSLSWREFESYIAEWFREQGYFVIETPEGPDNGVDLVLRKDGEKTYVQCKHWKANTVGVEKIRELLGSMAAGGAQAGIFVASGNYTRPAKDFARDCGITLIDGEQLAQFLAGRQAEPQRKEQTGSDSDVSCPLCSAQMVQRVAKRGKNKGNVFWGCSRYPECRGIRSV